jgi:hypothetical protein
MGVSRGRKHAFNVPLSDDVTAIVVWRGTVLGIAVATVSYTYLKLDLSFVLSDPFKFTEMLRKMTKLIFSKNMSDEVRVPALLGRVPVACGSPSIGDSRPE